MYLLAVELVTAENMQCKGVEAEN